MENSRRDLADSDGSERRIKHGSNSTVVNTVGTVESNWESYLVADKPEFSLNPWHLYLTFRNAKILTVEPVIFLYMFATYMYYPLYQQYVILRYAKQVLENTSFPENATVCIDKDMVTNYTGSNTTYDKYVENKSTLLTVYTTLAVRIPSIVITLILGSLADRYGRRLPIILVGIGGILSGLVDMCVAVFELDLNVYIVSNVLAGLSGDLPTVLMASFAYISDVSSAKWRTVRIGLVEAMLFFSGLVAEYLGGLWFQCLDCDVIPPLILNIACYAGIILYTLIFLPPSLTREERRRKTLNKPRGIKALARGASVFCTREYSIWQLWVAIIPIFMYAVNMIAPLTLDIYFFSDFNWSPGRFGALTAVGLGSHMVVLMVVLPLLVALKFPDPLLSIIGGLVNCGANAFKGLSTRTFEFFIGSTVQGLDAMMLPPLRGYMSRLIHVEDQGVLFAVIATVESVGSLASLAFTFIFPKLINHGLEPGTIYFAIAAFGLLPLPFVSVLLVHWCMQKLFRRHTVVFSSGIGTDEVSEKTPILSVTASPPPSYTSKEKPAINNY